MLRNNNKCPNNPSHRLIMQWDLQNRLAWGSQRLSMRVCISGVKPGSSKKSTVFRCKSGNPPLKRPKSALLSQIRWLKAHYKFRMEEEIGMVDVASIQLRDQSGAKFVNAISWSTMAITSTPPLKATSTRQSNSTAIKRTMLLLTSVIILSKDWAPHHS